MTLNLKTMIRILTLKHPSQSKLGRNDMTVSMIVALSENGVIGNKMKLPWHISADLKRFKSLTMGHPIVMGRKTYESIGRLLPGRSTIIVSRQHNYQVAGATVVQSIEQALEVANDDPQVFIVGGNQIYQLAAPLVNKLYVTRIHALVTGDTHFTAIAWEQWKQVSCERHGADEKNDHDYSFEVYHRLDQ